LNSMLEIDKDKVCPYKLLAMARYLTVSELVDRCSPVGVEAGLDEERRRIWLRRARHWTAMGILPSAPASRDGTGHHRRYEEKVVYIAAVLFRISDLGVSVSVMRDVARDLQRLESGLNLSGDDLKLRKFWQQAIAGRPPGNYYLVMWITYEGFVYVEGIGPKQDLSTLETRIDPQDAPVVVLSLTNIFAMVRR
jgi:DNA-binding transcriptional MerR regulator